MVRSATYRGWHWDKENSRLEFYYDNTKVGHITGTTFVTATGVGVTVTDTGLTVTAGGATVTAGDIAATVGNYRGGPINAFATTEPTQAIVLEAGTAPAGAITTSAGIYATATTLNKIVAGGTADTIQT